MGIKKILRAKFPERKFRVPRIWSNEELKKFSGFFDGDIVNVSGWKDEDKQGGRYKSYFSNASSYVISNYYADNKGMCGVDEEFFLDLESDLEENLHRKFQVVFNHTTLEHIFDFKTAFGNLCLMSHTAVILVVPYIQQIHGRGYSDYWRFTPHALKKMFDHHGFSLKYCSCNGKDKASIYLFSIAFRKGLDMAEIPSRFDLKLNENQELYGPHNNNVIGGNVI